jgi:hypothetical protein
VAWSPGALSRTIAASIGAGLAAWAPAAALGGVGGLVLGLATGAFAFTVLAAALRILPADDARWLDEAAGGRLGLLTRAWAAP